ncbi:MAG: ABC transporter substrate-binding protein [bacterium]|nr:ABC transporter substrate-binding protein [bacterium]
MKKSMKTLLAASLTAIALLTGCGSSAQTADTTAADSTTATEAAETTTTASTTTEQTTAASSDTSTDASYTVGIAQFANHGSLDNCRNGFIEGLAEEGIVEGVNLTIEYENANADGGTSSQIITNFVAKKADLVCAIATPIAQSAYSICRKNDIPVIFTAVTDPIAAELANPDKTPVGEITGTSDKLPVTEQLAMIREILPDATKIGILYTTSEVNSASTIAEYEAAAPDYGFEIISQGVSSSADIPLATDSLLEKMDVDCLNNLTDNTVVSSLPLILDKAAKKNIPVFGSEVEQVKIGCLASMGLDYVELGKQTGKMAAQVLKGEKKASEISFETIEEASFYYNSKVAENLGITLPESLTSTAKETFDQITE